jgi:hypothetical protein
MVTVPQGDGQRYGRHAPLRFGRSDGACIVERAEGFVKIKRRPRQAALKPLHPFTRTRLLVVHPTLVLHFFVLLHHFLSHLLPFRLLVGCEHGVDLVNGRFVDLFHLRLLIRRS